MAEKVILVSDLSGNEGAQRVVLAVNQRWFEIDLTRPEQQELAAALQPFLAHARPHQPGPKRRDIPKMTPAQRDEIRVWAKQQGYQIAGRGRIPMHILDAHRTGQAENGSTTE